MLEPLDYPQSCLVALYSVKLRRFNHKTVTRGKRTADIYKMTIEELTATQEEIIVQLEDHLDKEDIATVFDLLEVSRELTLKETN